MIGIAWYHAKGCANHMIKSKPKMRVASFQRLKRTRPLINAAIVGLRNVSKPIDALGFTAMTNHPKVNPAIPPHRGPKKGAVEAENSMLEKVMTAAVPRTG